MKNKLFNLYLVVFCLLISFVFFVLIVSQEFPCMLNHAFVNTNYAYCHECGQVLSGLCVNGHRVDGVFCTICGERVKE